MKSPFSLDKFGDLNLTIKLNNFVKNCVDGGFCFICTTGGKQMIVLKQGQQLITTDGKAIQQTQQPMQQMIIVKQSSPDKTQTTTTISQQQLQQLLLKQQQANENKPTSITTTVSQQQLQQLLAKQQQFMVLKQQAGKQGQATQQIKLVATTGGSGASPQQIKQLTQAITTAQLQKMQPRIIATNQRVSTPGTVFYLV